MKHLPLRLLLFIGIVCGVALLLVLMARRPGPGVPLRSASGIPLPFGGTVTTLRGQTFTLGTTTDNRQIVDMSFENADAETFGVNDFTFVLLPEGSSTFSSGAPLSVAITPGKRYYGYRYDSRHAAKEQAMQRLNAWQITHLPADPYVFAELFPEEFFQSGPGKDWADDILRNRPPFNANGTPRSYTFAELWPGTFIASSADVASRFSSLSVSFASAADVPLTADSLTLLIAEDPATVMTVRGLTWCGDQIPGNTPGEECDDGNKSNTDACTNACRNARCGDTFIRAGTEQCDDGNQTAIDGCDPQCQNEPPLAVLSLLSVKNGTVNVIYGKNFPACARLKDEAGNTLHTQDLFCTSGPASSVTIPATDLPVTVGQSYRLCHPEDPAVCSAPITATDVGCGNHIVDPGEQCDDGNRSGDDLCSADCTCDYRAKTLQLADTNHDGALSDAEGEDLLILLDEWLNADAPDPAAIVDANCDGTINADDVRTLTDAAALLLQQ